MPPGVNTHYSVRSATLGGHNKKDYIEELTKQLDVCQKVQQQRFNDGGGFRLRETPKMGLTSLDSEPEYIM